MSRDVPGLDSALYAQSESMVPNLTACDVLQAGQVLGYALGMADTIIFGMVVFLGVAFARYFGDAFAVSPWGIRLRWALRRQARELRRVRPIEGS